MLYLLVTLASHLCGRSISPTPRVTHFQQKVMFPQNRKMYHFATIAEKKNGMVHTDAEHCKKKQCILNILNLTFRRVQPVFKSIPYCLKKLFENKKSKKLYGITCLFAKVLLHNINIARQFSRYNVSIQCRGKNCKKYFIRWLKVPIAILHTRPGLFKRWIVLSTG